jgi:hypothetical protein
MLGLRSVFMWASCSLYTLLLQKERVHVLLAHFTSRPRIPRPRRLQSMGIAKSALRQSHLRPS